MTKKETTILPRQTAAATVHRLKASEQGWRIPGWKRAFDIVGALGLILMLSPLFLLVALLIKLESKGPVFYISKRVGQGFHIFDFYKFRSMRVGASKVLDNLKQQNNQYRETAGAVETMILNQESDTELVQDAGMIPESKYRLIKREKEGNTFVKIKDDPRITRVGHIIRKTSIDELPQLFNVLKGDMSLVGNRPLPLYEAERLTDDDWVLRFKAPAGITGLWQVKGRGKAEVSEDERKKFDLEYADNYSLWMDLTILWSTLPAAVQEANV